MHAYWGDVSVCVHASCLSSAHCSTGLCHTTFTELAVQTKADDSYGTQIMTDMGHSAGAACCMQCSGVSTPEAALLCRKEQGCGTPILQQGRSSPLQLGIGSLLVHMQSHCFLM
jgi:hypothetical protein